MIEVTQNLVYSQENWDFCQETIERIKRNPKRKPFLFEKISKKGVHQICVRDESVMIYRGVLVYCDNKMPVMPEFIARHLESSVASKTHQKSLQPS